VQHRTGTGADAVDGGDDRLRGLAHRQHQVAGHSRELQQLRHAHADQRPDDLVHVAAGAEVPAFAGQHHRLDVGGIGQGAEQFAQLLVRIEGERVLAVRPIQRKDADILLHAPDEVLGLVAGGREAGGLVDG